MRTLASGSLAMRVTRLGSRFAQKLPLNESKVLTRHSFDLVMCLNPELDRS